MIREGLRGVATCLPAARSRRSPAKELLGSLSLCGNGGIRSPSGSFFPLFFFYHSMESLVDEFSFFLFNTESLVGAFCICFFMTEILVQVWEFLFLVFFLVQTPVSTNLPSDSFDLILLLT